jgi:non-specific serine/threonine protein kinase
MVDIAINIYPVNDWIYLANLFLVERGENGVHTHVLRRANLGNIEAAGVVMDENVAHLFRLLDRLSVSDIESRNKPTKSNKPVAFKALLEDPKLKSRVSGYIFDQLSQLLSFAVEHSWPIGFELDKRSLVKDALLTKGTGSLSPFISFRRTPTGMEYRLELGSDADRWRISKRRVVVLTNTDPAWLIVDGALVRVPGINGFMVKPFRDKDVVGIPSDKQSVYFRQFVAKTAGRIRIEAEGFDLSVENTLRTLRIEPIEHLLESKWYFKVEFVYDGGVFSLGDKRTQVTIVREDGDHQAALHQVRRDLEQEERRIQALLPLGLEPSGHLLSLPKQPNKTGIDVCLEWLTDREEQLSSMGIEVVPIMVSGRAVAPLRAELVMETSACEDWFDVQGLVRVGSYKLPFRAFVKHIIQGERHFVLPDNRIFIIPEEWFARYSELLSVATDGEGDVLRVQKSQFTLLEHAGLSSSTEKDFPVVDPECVAFELPAGLNADLRPYQLTGAKWLVGHYREKLGACLADDMGLGKTLQTISLLVHIKESHHEDLQMLPSEGVLQLDLFRNYQDEHKPLQALIIMPASLVFNWQREIQRFAPGLFVCVHTGSKRLKDKRAICAHDVVLTTYHTARQDMTLLGSIPWRVIVLDESQHIKNSSSEISQVVRSLKGGFRVSLSGTPIENALSDLWTQMEFINPGTLGSYKSFKEQFQVPIEKKGDQVARIRLFDRVRPFFLRRTKEEVAPDLPPISEHIFYTEMVPEQEKLYEKTKSAIRNEILSLFDDPKTRLQALQALMRLRQLSNHPVLADPTYKGESGKFNDVLSQWDVVRKSGHKALFFSSFEKSLWLYRSRMEQDRTPFAWLTGSVAAQDRAAQVQRFQEDASVQAFLMTTKAGGVGLNLTAADYVFLLDPWWNPAAERQAIARAHRIGQQRPVTVLRFISRNSIEEKILQLQARKEALGEGLFSDGSDMPALGREEMEMLLG